MIIIIILSGRLLEAGPHPAAGAGADLTLLEGLA